MRELFSKEFLEKEYLELGKTAKQIAEESGKCQRTIKLYLEKFKIPKRFKDYNLCIKKCERCEKDFSSVYYYSDSNGKIIPEHKKNAKYCSKECSNKSWENKKRATSKLICKYCEKDFEGICSKKYCSQLCRSRANNKTYEENFSKDFIFPEIFNKELIRKILNNVGKKIFNLTIKEYAGIKLDKRGMKANYFLCQCICGKECLVRIDQILNENESCIKKSCGCRGRKIYHNEYDFCVAYFKTILLGARTRSLEVEIDEKFIYDLLKKQNYKCAISGEKIIMDIRKNKTASLDRKDSSQGYTKDNIQWVHKDINKMKQDFTDKYFIEMCKKVAITYAN